jgi:thioredoxin 1
MDALSSACSCQGKGGDDLIPLLVVVAILAGVHAGGKWLKRLKGRKNMANNSEKNEEGSACGSGGGSCCSGPGKWIWIVLALAVVGVLIAKNAGKKPASDGTPEASAVPAAAEATAAQGVPEPAGQTKAIPRLVDLGATKCIPCKMMAPILEDLKKTYAGKMDVQFIDVWENPDAGKKYGINVIPTQIFYDAQGKELFRHEGFFGKEDILAKWKEFGVDLSAKAEAPPFSRWQPSQPDTRGKDAICYLCDGGIPSNSLVVVKTDKGDVRLCGMHHYFVMYSCLTEDKTGFDQKVTVADWATGNLVPISDAVYVYGMEAKTGRPTVKVFAGKEAAEKERQASGGNVVDLAVLQGKELANKCGFCDRVVYPEDVAEVIVGDVKTWGCCSHCALGVAARTGKDIEVRERDRLTGEKVVVKTLNGSVASLEPATAVAWFGQRTKSDGTHASAGCFHQGFFVNAESLKKWVDANPLETGEMITIQKALADKMKLTPQQISKACKIGECAPK